MKMKRKPTVDVNEHLYKKCRNQVANELKQADQLIIVGTVRLTKTI